MCHLLNLFLFYFQKRICHEKISNEFQFDREKATPDSVTYRVYKYNNMCLGVAESCGDANLYLIKTEKYSNYRRCFLTKLLTWPTSR